MAYTVQQIKVALKLYDRLKNCLAHMITLSPVRVLLGFLLWLQKLKIFPRKWITSFWNYCERMLNNSVFT